MTNSLQDQLIKAGLASKAQLNKNRAETRKKAKQNRNRKKSAGPPADTESSAYLAAKAAEQKAARDRELNRQREEAKAKKALRAQIRDLIRRHRLNDPEAEIAYNFVLDKLVKRVYATKEQHQQLAAGKLAVAAVGERLHIVSPETARKLHALDPKLAIHREAQGSEPAGGEDDAYAGYEVPDDLMW